MVRAVADAGADAIEIGIPFSDPVMDGPVIQEASERALAAGATPQGILAQLRGADTGVPLAVMTYYNICFHMGHERFADALARRAWRLRSCPTCPLEEVGPWAAAADDIGVETVHARRRRPRPTSGCPRVCERARGFVYAVGLLGVTGERDEPVGERHRDRRGASRPSPTSRC